jgi:endonuclease/exonuclease/phosphatase (EEP) superfamily protein YafD
MKLTLGWIFYIVIASVAFLLLCCRNHFYFGAVFIATRWVLFALGVLVLLALRKKVRTPRFIIMAVLVSALVLEFVWCQLLFASLKPPAGNTPISMLTYNVYFKNKTPELSLQLINAHKVDIMAFQEVDMAWKIWLDKALNATYPYKSVKAVYGTHGLAIYSKYPILSDTTLLNQKQQQVAQFVELLVGKQRLLVVNVHLASPAAALEHPDYFWKLYRKSFYLRKEQYQEVNQWINTLYPNTQLRVLTGDLNTMRIDPMFRTIKQDWVNLHEEVGNGFGLTFPNMAKRKTLITLDYILLQGQVKPISCEVLKGGSSDHFGVLGKFTF